MNIDKETVRPIIEWYRRNRRELPWRETDDPYRIWLSEVILQQTRVAQGLEYYRRFTARYPDVTALAQASEDEVLKLWQGLGYYSRARNLLAAARDIEKRFGGHFPDTYEGVRSLKGIGDYTAAAVCSIAYGLPYAVVDGNVFRVLARLFASDIPIDTPAGKKHFGALAEELLDSGRPGLHNQALMEFGALQCTPKNPDCTLCPLSDRCIAGRCGLAAKFPVKQGKNRTIPRYFHYFYVRCGNKTYLSRRNMKDIWQGLYEFPLIETETPASPAEIFASEAFRNLFPADSGVRITGTTDMPRHQLSHRIIHARFYETELSEGAAETLNGYLSIENEQIGEYAVSRLTEAFLEKRSDRYKVKPR